MKIKIFVKALLFALLISSCGNKETPNLYVQSVSNPTIKINGTWHISTNLKEEFWKQNELNADWKEIKVPGEIMMQGFSIKNEVPFAYKKRIAIPKDYQDKAVYLQFDGVYSYARVWVNGQFVRDHYGGFTRWKCDITPFIKAGNDAWITVEVTDRADDISYASGYAKHQIAGILRDVHLLALPKTHPEKVKIETDFDAAFSDATLKVSGTLNNASNNAEIKLRLFDDAQNEIKLQSETASIKNDKAFHIKNKIAQPKKWDAEHPNLYTLKVSFLENGKLQWSKAYRFGFRELKVDGNRFLVNGNPVKLRGACRHDIHPTLGRVSTPEYELKDVLLAKEANMNYIRTSHYPPSENFLKLCDEYGIYVEDETAVCFVINYRIKGYKIASKSQHDPAYTDRYLSQLEEMVTAHQNHPSVVIWSIGNENLYGMNFKKSYDWIRKNEPSRPVMFSYPGSAPDSIMPYNILSMHYPGYEGTMEQYGKKTEGFGSKDMPVIFDEWAHVACYNNATIKEDPNIRNFWGQSLDKMWSKTFDADGGLGGAIWGMIDETFMLPKNLEGFRDWWGINDNTVLPYKGTTIGYGEWGIVDIWRRKKPEFWNTKKAYSPIKITSTTIADYKTGSGVNVPIYNRFDQTNLSEVTIKYTYKDSTKTLETFELKPHKKGTLKLPLKSWDTHEEIAVDFYDINNNLIDSYNIKQDDLKPIKKEVAASSAKITVHDTNGKLMIKTTKGTLIFDKKTALFDELKNGEKSLKISGPFMTYKTKGDQLTYSSNHINHYGKNGTFKTFDYTLKNNKLTISAKGNYNNIKATFTIVVSANANITTAYTFTNLPKENVRELGVRYKMENTFDTLTWKRLPYWSAYPKDHLSAPTGKVPLYSKVTKTYRTKPEKPWVMDTKSFYYEGTDDESPKALTYTAKATKEHITEYTLIGNNKKALKVYGNGELSCRLSKTNERTLELYINNIVDYIDLSWGNYQRNIVLDSEYSGEINFMINPNFDD